MHDLKISVKLLLGGTLSAWSDKQGQIIFNLLCRALQKDKKVLLSFEDVELICVAFLNAAIGQLYGVFSEEHIRKYLSVDISIDDVGLIKHVVDTAKKHFRSRSGSRL